MWRYLCSPSKITLLCAFLLIFMGLRFSALAVPDCSKEKDADVLILGAGFAGLSAAEQLSKNGIDNFLIIDQGDKIGGRAQSVKFGGTTVELGPQWVLNVDKTVPEAQQQPLFRLANKCNITLREDPLGIRGMKTYRGGVDITQTPDYLGSLARFAAASAPDMVANILQGLGENDDLSSAGGLRAAGWLARSRIDEFVEHLMVDVAFGEPAATLGYKDSFDPAVTNERLLSFTDGGINDIATYIVTDDAGFFGLAQCLADEFLVGPDDPRILLETSVRSVDWSEDCVCATVVQGGEEKEYCGTYAIVTFSTGVLQNRAVNFDPELPLDVHLTLNKLQMARFLRVYAVFNETFWDTDVDFIGIIDDLNGREYYSLFSPWGHYFPEDKQTPVVQALLFGDAAERISSQDKEITRHQIGEVFRTTYGDEASDPLDVIMGDFIPNPYFYGNLGGISTPGVTNQTYCLLNKPIGNMFLAGDGTAYSRHSSAQGAIVSGVNAARRVVDAIKQPPTITFLNDSPQVNGRTLSAEFSVSKSVSLVVCSLDRGPRTDCSSGSVEYTNLSRGRHTLKILARNAAPNDRGAVTRSVFINDASQCSVLLINSGIRVFEGKVSIEFSYTGLTVSSFSCNVDSEKIFPCSSPLDLTALRSGFHRIRIRPVCNGDQRQSTFSFIV